MPPSKLPPFDPVAYAAKRREQIERAKELRNARSHTISASPPRDPSARRLASYPLDTGFQRRSRSRGASPPRKFGPNDPLAGNTRRARSRGASPPRRVGELVEPVEPQRRGRSTRKAYSLPEDAPALSFDEKESSWLVGSNGKAGQDDLSSFLDPSEKLATEPPPRAGRRGVSGPISLSSSGKGETLQSTGHERRASVGNIAVNNSNRASRSASKETSPRTPNRGSAPNFASQKAKSEDPKAARNLKEEFDESSVPPEGKGKGLFSRFRLKLFGKGKLGGAVPISGGDSEPSSLSPAPPNSSPSLAPSMKSSTATADSPNALLPIQRKSSGGSERSIDSPTGRSVSRLAGSQSAAPTRGTNEAVADSHASTKTPGKAPETLNRKKSGNVSEAVAKAATGSVVAAATSASANTPTKGEKIGGEVRAKTPEAKSSARAGSPTPAAKSVTGRGSSSSPGSIGRKEGKSMKPSPPPADKGSGAANEDLPPQSQKESEPVKSTTEAGSLDSAENGTLDSSKSSDEGKAKASWFTRSKIDGKSPKQSMDVASRSSSASGGLLRESIEVTSNLRTCPDCGRKFRPESLDKHVPICRKVFLTKRKVFDSTKKRLAGTEAAQLLRVGKKGPRKSVPSSSSSKGEGGVSRKGEGGPARVGGGGGRERPRWRAQSEELQAAIRAARQEKGALGKQ